MAKIIIQTQGKGGVGKSVISAYLSQFMLFKGRNCSFYDTDVVNPTFASFGALGAKRVSLGTRADEISPIYFDPLIEELLVLPHDGVAIIDVGASTFMPLVAYLNENRVLPLFTENNHEVRLQTIIVGGQPFIETLQNMGHINATFPNYQIDVWLNEYLGAVVTADGTPYDSSEHFKARQQYFRSIIRVPGVNMATYGHDINKMLTNKLTFQEALDDPANFNLMARQRIKNYRDEVYRNIELAGFHE